MEWKRTRTSSPISPYLASQESLVGCQICTNGRIVKVKRGHTTDKINCNPVPGTTDWFNVKYDYEDIVLSLNLLVDIEKGGLTFLD